MTLQPASVARQLIRSICNTRFWKLTVLSRFTVRSNCSAKIRSRSWLRGHFTNPLPGCAGAARQRVCEVPAQPGPGPDLRAAVRAHGEPRQHGELPEPGVADRADELASNAGGLQCHGSSAPGWNHQPHPRSAPAGTLQSPRCGHHLNRKRGEERCGKDAPWKSPKADFSTALGNPAQNAGFPLSHSCDDYGFMNKPKTKTGHFTCYEKRTF